MASSKSGGNRGGPGSQIGPGASGSSSGYRTPERAVSFRGRIYFVSGERGGVGKTTFSKLLIGILEDRNRSVFPIDADATNRDLHVTYQSAPLVDLRNETGYVDLLNRMAEAADGQDIVVSLPAAALSGATVHGAGFIEGLPQLAEQLNRNVIVIWLIDDKVLSVQMLKEAHERYPSLRFDVVGNEKLGDRFDVYEGSQIRKSIEAKEGKFYKLSRLPASVMAKYTNSNMTLNDAIACSPIGNRFALQAWKKKIEKELEIAGYFVD